MSVDLPIQVGIPAEYIPDQLLRLQLYRRMASLESINELEELEVEFADRFGSPVEQVQNLFYQLRVKILGSMAGLSSISVESDQMVLRFPPLPNGVTERALAPIGYQARAGKNAYWMRFDAGDPVWRETLIKVLNEIISQ